jgi:hypothetical protein
MDTLLIRILLSKTGSHNSYHGIAMPCREKSVKTGLFSYGNTIIMRDKLWM